MNDNIEFFRRFTTVAGNVEVVSEPYEVTPYRSVEAEALLFSSVGSPTVNGSLEGSSDMNVWTALDGPDPLTAGTPAPFSLQAPPRYIRARISITGGTNPVTTFWFKGVVRVS